MDKQKLAKVLALTASDKDGEALAAVRMANRILAMEGLTWLEVISPVPTTRVTVTAYKAEEDWVPPHLKDKVTIEIMFRAVYAQPRSDNEEFWQFMDSIHHRWNKYQNLTQGQYTALKRSYQRVPPR